LGTPRTITADEQILVRPAYGDVGKLAFGFASSDRQDDRDFGAGGRGPAPAPGAILKITLSTIFPWVKQIKQAQIAAAQARSERYSKLFELDDMVKKSLVLLRTGRSDEPPTS